MALFSARVYMLVKESQKFFKELGNFCRGGREFGKDDTPNQQPIRHVFCTLVAHCAMPFGAAAYMCVCM